MKTHDVIQGSDQWLKLRAGIVTASEMDALVSPTGVVRKGDGLVTYMITKLAEKWHGGPLPSPSTYDMEQGVLQEERAIPCYQMLYGTKIERVGFVTTDDGKVGCSPDGVFADTNRGIEIKCPKITTHIRYLLDNEVPSIYVAQVQTSMFVTGAESWVFMSYHRECPPLVVNVARDVTYQAAITQAVSEFQAKFDFAWNRLCDINGGPPERKPEPTVAQPPVSMWTHSQVG